MIFLAYFLSTTTISASARLIFPSSSNFMADAKLAKIQDCLDRISERHFTENSLILYMNNNTGSVLEEFRLKTLPHVLLRGEGSRKTLPPLRYRKIDVYLLVPSSTYPLEVFYFLKNTASWNPRAKFVLILEKSGDNDRYFKFFTEHFVQKVLILTLEDDDDNEGKASGMKTISACHDDGNLFHRYTPIKKTWRDFTLTVSLVEFPPYVRCSKCRTKRGMELFILRLLQGLLGFRVVYLNETFGTWGKRLSNRTYTEAYGSLETHAADLAIGFFHAKFPENLHFDFSFPYMEDEYKWIVPAPGHRSHWKSVLLIFTTGTWILLLFLVVFLAHIFYVAGTASDKNKRHLEPRDFRSMGGCFLVVLRCLLGQSVRPQPIGLRIRYVFVIWCLFSWIITTAFQSNLIIYLNFDRLYKPIENVKELIESKLEFGFFEEVAELFDSHQNNKEDQYVHDKYKYCDLSYSCLNRTAFRKDFATIKPAKVAARTDYYVNSNDGSLIVHLFKKNVMNVRVSMVFVKGHPIYEKFNRLLLDIKSAGFVEYSYGIVEHRNNLKRIKMSSSSFNSYVLDLDEMQGIFWLLLIGWLVSAFVFLAEYFSYTPELVD